MSADTTPTNSPRTQRVDSLMTSRSMPHIMHDYSVDGMITTLCNADVAPCTYLLLQNIIFAFF